MFRSLIIEKLKLCVKRMRFLVSLSIEEKKRQKFEKSIYSKSQYFLSVSSLLFSRLFPPSENEYICIFCKFGLRAQYFSPLFDIGRQRRKSPQWQKTNFESISKLTDRRRSISHQPLFPVPNKTKNFVVS